MLCKRRYADTPTRRYVSRRRPIFIATLRAGASWLFFLRRGGSTRMNQIWVLRSRLEKQPTDLRQYTCYFGDRTLTRKNHPNAEATSSLLARRIKQ